MAQAQLQVLSLSLEIAKYQASSTQNELGVGIEQKAPLQGENEAKTATPATIIEKVMARSKEAGADPYKMVEIAICESRLNPNARNLTAKEDSRGIFQVNVVAHPNYDVLRLYEVDYNLMAAMQIWKNESYGAWKNCLQKHLAQR